MIKSKTSHKTVHRHPRMVARGDGFKVIATGRRRQVAGDLYAILLGKKWQTIIVLMVALYFVINAVFALGYLAIKDGIANAREGSFADAFFFSVQTLATIGYGGMAPRGLTANLLVTIEAMVGFAFYGVLTGLVFSKFSRPTSRILFSDKSVITLYEGKPHFMLRLANERDNRIVDASAKLTLMRDGYTQEGQFMRRFYDLPLVRKEIPILRFSWTVMHEINGNSPLYGLTPESLDQAEAEIIISINGMDETLSQHIHARHSYIADEIVFDASFDEIIDRRDNYEIEIRYDRFHDIKVNENNE